MRPPLHPVPIDTEKYEKKKPENTPVVAVYWKDHTDSLEEPFICRSVSWGAMVESSDEVIVLAHGWDPIDGWKGFSTILANDVIAILPPDGDE